MFSVHYLNREGGIVSKATLEAARLLDAIAGARKRIKEMQSEPGRQHPVGFLIFDATGKRLLHRESTV